MSHVENQKRILALDVRPRSFGYVIFEGPDRLLDWGVRSFRKGVNAVQIPAAKKLATLLDEFAPTAVVLKEPSNTNKKRAKLLGEIQKEAENHRISVRFVSSKKIKDAFAGHERNKHEIASALAARFPELAPRLPPKRKIWQPEDYRMNIFDAAALGVAYFNRGQPVEPRKSVPPPELSQCK